MARAPQATEAVFTTVADGVRAQVIQRQVLPAHLDTSAHEGRAAGCRCTPLLGQLTTQHRWPVVPRGAREACTQEEHDMRPLRLAIWATAPLPLRQQALHGRVELTITMCAYCGAIEVRDTSYHVPAGLRAAGHLAPRRRSDVLGWYSGKRPGGRVYL